MCILYIKVIYKIGDILVQSIEILNYQANKMQLPRLGCTYLQDLDNSQAKCTTHPHSWTHGIIMDLRGLKEDYVSFIVSRFYGHPSNV